MTDTTPAKRRARAAYYVNHPTAAFRTMRHLAADVEELAEEVERLREENAEARRDVLEVCRKTYAVCDGLFEGRPVNLIAFSDELDRLSAKWRSA